MDVDLDMLRARAAAHGIDAGYDDVAGVHHDATAQTLRVLLAAIEGADAASAHATEAARPPVAQAVPAVWVSHAHHAADAPPLAGWAAAGALDWELVTEDGARSSGRTAAAAGTWPVPPGLPLGYHRLVLRSVADATLHAELTLIACPSGCHSPSPLAEGGRVWGLALQLYAVRSARNWGIGDFTDLADVAQLAARQGAALVGINPLHALFPDRPEQASPYSPSDRSALNALYIDIEGAPEFAASPAAQARVAQPDFQARLAALRAATMVDYAGVARAKLEILALLHAQFGARGDAARRRTFGEFQHQGGAQLRAHALYAALREQWGGDWRHWPREFASPHATGIAAFADAQRERIEYHEYLQWLADDQLGAASRHAIAAGMTLGLYRDIAVGVDPAGAEAWMHAGLIARDVSVGAPPDEFNPAGQDWGLPPYAPTRLRDAAYAPFIELLRANMRHAGAVRIDHVMGLLRLFWVPAGAGPAAGTYVHYPLDDLLGILALESVRHRCLVIGEDLGTVPPAIREAMATYGILSYRPLYFERTHDGAFAPPDRYPRNALVAASTHDLPTLAGFWQDADFAARMALDLYPDPAQREHQQRERQRDRARMLAALRDAGLLPPGMSIAAPPPSFDTALMVAVHRFLARTPSQVLVVQMEDALGEVEQVNLPATTEAMYPNWRRRLTVPLERWTQDGAVMQLFAALRAER